MEKFANKRTATTLTSILTSPLFVATATIGAFAYYYIFTYINAASYFMLTASIYLIYALVATSALLLATGVYSIRRLLAKSRVAAGTVGAPASVVTAVVGSLFSCGCHFSLLVSFLAAVGLSAGEIGSIGGFDLYYSNYIVGLFVIINIGLLYYMIRKVRVS
jgi:hypothetical protein